MSISVIIPAHNAAATICEALQSVRDQTLAPDEIIVVDDGSTDDTIQTVQEFLSTKVKECGERASRHRENGREKPSNVVEIPSAINHQPSTILSAISCRIVAAGDNLGPAAARNRGIKEARGDWIAFLDADDSWLPHRLEAQLAALERQPDAVMLCGGTRAVKNGREKVVKIEASKIVKSRENEDRETSSKIAGAHDSARESGLTILGLERFLYGNPIATSTVLVRKSAIEEAGWFDERFRGPEDYDLWLRIAARFPVVRLDLPLAVCRETEGSLSLDDRRFLPEILRVLDKAYGPGGVFEGRRGRGRARAGQMMSAAWMAKRRGALGRAFGLWAKALVEAPVGRPDIADLWKARARLLWFLLK